MGTRYDGEIVGLVAEPLFGGLRFSFRHDGIAPDQRFRYAVVLDGDLVLLLGNGERSGRIDGIPAGLHRLEVFPLREDVGRIPDFHGHPFGRRAWLTWDRASEADVRAYVVYTDGGSGSINFGAPAAVVDRITVAARWAVPPDAGSGSGRLTVGGGWTGEAVNAVFTVEVTGAGVARHNVRGAWESFPFVPGVAVYLPGGPVVTFEDPVGEYDNGDEWGVQVGPLNSWGSGDLAEGTHRFAIKARDAAGNLSAASSTVEVAILHRPGEVSNLAGEFVPEDDQIRLTWDLPADGDLAAVEVYSNHSRLFNALRDHVIESGPWATLAANAELETISEPLPGVWRFVVRTRDTAGRRSESAEVVLVDTQALPVGVALNAPDTVEVRASLAGMLMVSWGYDVIGGEDVAEFRVYEASDTSNALAIVLLGSELVPPRGDLEAEVGPFVSSTTLVVSAADGDGNERFSLPASGVPDDDAPTAPEDPRGVAN